MNFEVKTTPRLERGVEILAKRYKSSKADMKDFVESLEKNPMQRDELSPGIHKIRLAVVSKGKDKSGGVRVIAYTIYISENEGRVYLVNVHDKSGFSTTSVSTLKKVIPEQGTIRSVGVSEANSVLSPFSLQRRLRIPKSLGAS